MKKNLFLLLVSILLTFALVEVCLRAAGIDAAKAPDGPKTNWAKVPERIWTEYHPVLGWAHQKNKTAFHREGPEDIELRTNSVGFRGAREYAIEKSDSVKRILCLGDSFVFGFGVKDDETFCSRLEAENKQLEVLNSGVPGYGLDQIFIYFKTVAKDYRPDYVFIGVFPEGFWRATRAFADSGQAKPYFSLSASGELILHNNPVPPPFQLNTNQFPELVEYGGLEKWLMNSVLYRLIRKGIVQLGKELGWLDPDVTVEWVIGKAILKNLIDEIRAEGAEPVILIIPPDRWVNTTRKTSLRKALLRFVEKEKVEAIDVTPELYNAVQEAGIETYYINGTGHWTPQGHQLTADLIEKFLTRRGYL